MTPFADLDFGDLLRCADIADYLVHVLAGLPSGEFTDFHLAEADRLSTEYEIEIERRHLIAQQVATAVHAGERVI